MVSNSYLRPQSSLGGDKVSTKLGLQTYPDEFSRNRHKINQIQNVQFDKLPTVPIASHTLIPKGSKEQPYMMVRIKLLLHEWEPIEMVTKHP